MELAIKISSSNQKQLGEKNFLMLEMDKSIFKRTLKSLVDEYKAYKKRDKDYEKAFFKAYLLANHKENIPLLDEIFSEFMKLISGILDANVVLNYIKGVISDVTFSEGEFLIVEMNKNKLCDPENIAETLKVVEMNVIKETKDCYSECLKESMESTLFYSFEEFLNHYLMIYEKDGVVYNASLKKVW